MPAARNGRKRMREGAMARAAKARRSPRTRRKSAGRTAHIGLRARKERQSPAATGLPARNKGKPASSATGEKIARPRVERVCGPENLAATGIVVRRAIRIEQVGVAVQNHLGRTVEVVEVEAL